MAYKPNYEQGAAIIPISALRKISNGAPEKDIKILALMLEYGLPHRNFSEVKSELIEKGLVDEQSLLLSCAYWNGAEVLISDGESVPKKEVKKSPAATNTKLETGRNAESASSEQLVAWMDKNQKTQNFIKTCEDIYGDIFNRTELSIVLTFYKEYKMNDESILIVLGYCKENGYNMTYAKRIFMRLVDNGITAPQDVKTEMEFLQKNHSYEAMVKRVFGINRAFSSKEKQTIEKWHKEYAFTEEEIQLAFDRAAATNKATIAYCGKTLSSWRDEGFKTAEDIKSYLESQKSFPGKTGKNTSFATDDFLRAAVEKSYNKKDGEN